MCKKKEDDGEKKEGEEKPKFCSCEPGSGLRTKVCCFFCCGDMFENQGADDDDEEAGCCGAKKPWPENPNADWTKGHCKDVYCIVIFGLFWCIMAAVAAVGFTMGSYHRVLFSTDFDGQTCGTTEGGGSVESTCPRGMKCPNDLSQKKRIVWPRMGTDLIVSMATGFDTTDVYGSIKNLKLYGICSTDCPQTGDYVCNYDGESIYLPKKTGIPAAEVGKYSQSSAPTYPTVWGLDPHYEEKRAAVTACYDEMWASGMGDSAGLPGMGTLSAALISPVCTDIIANCWINPIATKSILYRCIPKFWELKNSGKECILPATVGNSTDTSSKDYPKPVSAENPSCITMKKTDTGEVDMPKGAEVIFDIMAGIGGRLMRMMGDLVNSSYVIVCCGFLFSFALSWGWVIVLQYFVSFVVWTTIIVFYIAWFCITLVLYMKGGILTKENIELAITYVANFFAGRVSQASSLAAFVTAAANNSESDPTPDVLAASTTYTLYFQIAAFACTIAWFILIIAGIAMFKKIKVAIAIIREAAKALQALPTLVFFPIWSLALTFVVGIYWGIVMLFLMSAGELKVGDLTAIGPNTTGLPSSVSGATAKIAKYEGEDAGKWLMLIHLFGTFWTLNLIEGCGLTVIATSICAWYFTEEKDWKHATFEEEKKWVQQMHDKPCWNTNKPMCAALPADHALQPCTAQRCFFRAFGCTRTCYFWASTEERRRVKLEAAGEAAPTEDKAADGDVEASGEEDVAGSNPMTDDSANVDAAIAEDSEVDLSDSPQFLCAENHGCPRAMCLDCGAPEPCKVQQFCFKINKGKDYDGDGEIDCMERLDARPAPGCIIYTLTCCCFCQLCCYCCKNPIEKDKCWKKGAFRYSVDFLREEACPRNTRPDIEVCTCFKGCYRANTFHIGSIMIGAFLIAIIQTIRVVLVYIEKQVKQAMGKKKSKLVEQLFKILQGIMWVFEQCMKFVTRNTYIMIAMRDLGFARASATAVGLLISNVFVLSMVKIFAIAVIVIGKGIVVSACMGIALMWMQFDPTFGYDGALPLNGTLFQSVLVGVCSFIVAQIFFYTFQMTIDTILLCFCEDCYQNDGLPQRNAALREVIATNSMKAPVPSSIIYMKGDKMDEFDMLVKLDKWSLKDLKKAIKSGNRADAPGIPSEEDMELVVWNKKAKAFVPLENGKIKKSPIHVIFKRHYPIFLRKVGTEFPGSMKDPTGQGLSEELVARLHKHGIKVKKPKLNPSAARAQTHGKVVEV